jgi:ribosomal protein S12
MKRVFLVKVNAKAKRYNSAIQKFVQVQPIKNRKMVTAFVPVHSLCLTIFGFLDAVLMSTPWASRL